MNDFDSDDLSAKLRAWKVEPQVPSSFQRGVWQRIAAHQSARGEAFWPAIWEAFAAQLGRPRYAAALFAVSLAVSLCAANVRAQGENARHWQTLGARYAESIDPLAATGR